MAACFRGACLHCLHHRSAKDTATTIFIWVLRRQQGLAFSLLLNSFPSLLLVSLLRYQVASSQPGPLNLVALLVRRCAPIFPILIPFESLLKRGVAFSASYMIIFGVGAHHAANHVCLRKNKQRSYKGQKTTKAQTDLTIPNSSLPLLSPFRSLPFPPLFTLIEGLLLP